MAAYFFDSSALVKRYVRETGTGWVISLFKPSGGHTCFVARIASVEIVSALTRRVRGATLSAAGGTKAIARFRRAFSQKLFKIDITSDLLEFATALAEKHALRGYDAVQLAAALQLHAERMAVNLPPIRLVSADDALNAAAMLEGLSVDNPNLHP